MLIVVLFALCAYSVEHVLCSDGDKAENESENIYLRQIVKEIDSIPRAMGTLVSNSDFAFDFECRTCTKQGQRECGKVVWTSRPYHAKYLKRHLESRTHIQICGWGLKDGHICDYRITPRQGGQMGIKSFFKAHQNNSKSK